MTARHKRVFDLCKVRGFEAGTLLRVLILASPFGCDDAEPRSHFTR